MKATLALMLVAVTIGCCYCTPLSEIEQVKEDRLPDDEEIAPLSEIEQVKDDSLPDDEEIAPLGEIEQVKEDMLPSPFNPQLHIHCYTKNIICRGPYKEVNTVSGCCCHSSGKSFEVFRRPTCYPCN